MTNASALTALQSLNATNKSLESTQARISTGYRVATASDNSAYWSIATTMRSDNKANSVVQDALGLGAGKVDTAYIAMESSIAVVNQIKQKILLAKTSSAENRAKVQSEIATYQAQLKDNIGGANYAGSNLLKTGIDRHRPDQGQRHLVLQSRLRRHGFDRHDRHRVGQHPPDQYRCRHQGRHSRQGDGDHRRRRRRPCRVLTLNVTVATLNDQDFDDLLKNVEAAISGMTTGAAELGAAKSRIDMQKDFVSKLMDSIDRGVGQLVDADMNKESTRLQALQVQQQLGIQALSIANSNSQSILALFKS